MTRLDEFLTLLPAAADTPGDVLVQGLDAALCAERALPGSVEEVIDALPAHTQADLRGLLELARALSALGQTVAPSAAFRGAGRQRLLATITAIPAESTAEPPSRRAAGPSAAPLAAPRRSAARVWLATRSRGAGHWLARAAASLTAVASAGLVTVNASASTLPGEPLYAVKQARETLAIQLAPSDAARAVALLQRADARLDETTRLVRQGRTAEAAQTASQCDEALSAANTTLQETAASAAEQQAQVELVAARLAKQQEQLAALLDEAPRSERTDLESAPDESMRGHSGAEEARPTATAATLPGGIQPRVAPVQRAELPSARPQPTTAPAPVEAVEGDDSRGRAPRTQALDQSGSDQGRTSTSPGGGDADGAAQAETQAEAEAARDDVPAAAANTPRPPVSQRRNPQPGSGRPGKVPTAPLAPAAAVEDQHDADGGGEEHGPAAIRIGGRGGDADLSATSGPTRPQVQPVTTAPTPAQGTDGDRSSRDQGGGRGATTAGPAPSVSPVPEGTGATRNGDRRVLSPSVGAGPATSTAAPTPTPRPAGGAQTGGGSGQGGQPGQIVQAGGGGGQSGGGSGSQSGGGGGGSRGGDAQRGGDQPRSSDHR